MKYLWKRATGLLLTSALVLGLAACGGTPTGNTNPPEDPGTQQTTQPVAPDSGAAGEKLVYSNGGSAVRGHRLGGLLRTLAQSRYLRL